MEVDYEDISNAAFMAFSTKATSDKAKQLVVEVLQLLQQSEKRTRKRNAADQASFELGVELVVSDLLSTLANKRSSWVYRSLFRNTFSGEPIGQTHSTALQPRCKTMAFLRHTMAET